MAVLVPPQRERARTRRPRRRRPRPPAAWRQAERHHLDRQRESGPAPAPICFRRRSRSCAADAAATIFSRSSAPPPPLIRREVRRNLVGAVDREIERRRLVERGERDAEPLGLARVASEVGTPTTSSPPRTRSASSSTKCLAVEPVPSPSRMPGLHPVERASGGLTFLRFDVHEFGGRCCQVMRLSSRVPAVQHSQKTCLSPDHRLRSRRHADRHRARSGRHLECHPRARGPGAGALRQGPHHDRRRRPAHDRDWRWRSSGARRAPAKSTACSRISSPTTPAHIADRSQPFPGPHRGARPACRARLPSSRSAPTSSKGLSRLLLDALGLTPPLRRDLRPGHLRHPEARSRGAAAHHRAGRRRPRTGHHGRETPPPTSTPRGRPACRWSRSISATPTSRSRSSARTG